MTCATIVVHSSLSLYVFVQEMTFAISTSLLSYSRKWLTCLWVSWSAWWQFASANNMINQVIQNQSFCQQLFYIGLIMNFNFFFWGKPLHSQTTHVMCCAMCQARAQQMILFVFPEIFAQYDRTGCAAPGKMDTAEELCIFGYLPKQRQSPIRVFV